MNKKKSSKKSTAQSSYDEDSKFGFGDDKRRKTRVEDDEEKIS